MSLKKEMAVAIFLGLLLGGGVAAGLRLLPDTTGQTESVNPTPETGTPSPSPAQLLDKNNELEILLPEHQSLVEEETVAISGKTNPAAHVAITTPVDETIITADGDGAFSAILSLTEGANEIHIISMHKESATEKKLIVNYITEPIQ